FRSARFGQHALYFPHERRIRRRQQRIRCGQSCFASSTRYLNTPLKDSYFITQPKQELEWVSDDKKSLSLRRVTKRFLLGASALTQEMQRALLVVILANKDLIV